MVQDNTSPKIGIISRHFDGSKRRKVIPDDKAPRARPRAPRCNVDARARYNVAARVHPRRVPPLQPNNVRMGEDNGKRV